MGGAALFVAPIENVQAASDMALSARISIDRKYARSWAGLTISSIVSGTPSFLHELVDQLLQLCLMLLGLGLCAALFCLLAKPVLEILVGLFPLFRSDVDTWLTDESEAAANCRNRLEILGGSVQRCKVLRRAALSISGCVAMMAL